MAKIKSVVMHRKNRIGKGKRVSSRWVLLGVLALLSSQVIFPSIKAHAEGGEWRLIDTKNYDGKDQVDATNANGAYSATSSSWLLMYLTSKAPLILGLVLAPRTTKSVS